MWSNWSFCHEQMRMPRCCYRSWCQGWLDMASRRCGESPLDLSCGDWMIWAGWVRVSGGWELWLNHIVTSDHSLRSSQSVCCLVCWSWEEDHWLDTGCWCSSELGSVHCSWRWSCWTCCSACSDLHCSVVATGSHELRDDSGCWEFFWTLWESLSESDCVPCFVEYLWWCPAGIQERCLVPIFCWRRSECDLRMERSIHHPRGSAS